MTNSNETNRVHKTTKHNPCPKEGYTPEEFKAELKKFEITKISTDGAGNIKFWAKKLRGETLFSPLLSFNTKENRGWRREGKQINPYIKLGA